MDEDAAVTAGPISSYVIELNLCKGNILVWNANDVKLLRETHHIVGTLVGSLPRSPRQNVQLSLPLQLMPEEAAVLIEYDAAKLVDLSIPKPSLQDVSAFKQARQRSFNEQQALWDTQNSQKKQQFASIIATARTTKKHRRAERARKLKSQKAEANANSNEATVTKRSLAVESTKFENDSKITKMHKMKDGNSVKTGPQMEGNTSIADGESSSESDLTSDSVKGTFGSDDNAQTDPDKHPSHSDHSVMETCQADCEITTDVHDAKDTRERAFSREHSPQDIHPKTRPSHETDSRVNVSRTLGLSKEKGKHCVESNQEIKQRSESASTTTLHQDLSADKLKIDIENNPEIQQPTAVECHQHKHGVEHEASLVTTVSEGRTDGKLNSDIENSPDILQTTMGTKDSCNHVVGHEVAVVVTTTSEAQTDEAKVFKKPCDPEPSSGYLVHLVTASPTTPRKEITEWKFPNTQQEVLRYAIFKDLWETGYYLTSGCKFGGDFLVYPGDPFLYHSYFIAICIPHEKTLSPLDLITYGRLGTNVKKTVILCSVNDNEVVYTSLQWTGFS